MAQVAVKQSSRFAVGGSWLGTKVLALRCSIGLLVGVPAVFAASIGSLYAAFVFVLMVVDVQLAAFPTLPEQMVVFSFSSCAMLWGVLQYRLVKCALYTDSAPPFVWEWYRWLILASLVAGGAYLIASGLWSDLDVGPGLVMDRVDLGFLVRASAFSVVSVVGFGLQSWLAQCESYLPGVERERLLWSDDELARLEAKGEAPP